MAADRPELDVLIVEDQPGVRSVMSHILTQAGYSVRDVEDGSHALAALSKNAFRAVVCDIHMPVLDGVGFYDKLRTTYGDMRRRVLFVTAVADTPGMRAFLDGTECKVLEKPYELRAFVDAVATLVGRAPARGLLF